MTIMIIELEGYVFTMVREDQSRTISTTVHTQADANIIIAALANLGYITTVTNQGSAYHIHAIRSL